MKNELSTVSKEAATAIDVASKTVQRSVKSKRTAYSTKELAEQLKTSKDVILTAARKCLPNKTIEHGKRTFWNDAEATIILDYMKAYPSNNRSVEFNSTDGNQTLTFKAKGSSKAGLEGNCDRSCRNLYRCGKS